MTNSSSRRAVDDDSSNEKKRSFPSHHDRRQLLLKLIRHQMNSAQKPELFIDAGVGVRNPQRPRNIDASVQVNDKHENTPDPARENGNKHSVVVKKHDDDDDAISVDLEWTTNFDSTKKLSQYRHDYLNAISYLLEDFELHPEYSDKVFIPKTENERCARIFSTSNLGSVPPPAKEVHPNPRMHWTVPHKFNRPVETDSTCNFCVPGASTSASGDGNLPIAKSFISKILSSVSLPSCIEIGRSTPPSQYYLTVLTLAILLLGLFMSVPYLAKKVFKFVNEFEWPWSVFMKESLLKGFIYSANLNMYDEDFDWS